MSADETRLVTVPGPDGKDSAHTLKAPSCREGPAPPMARLCCYWAQCPIRVVRSEDLLG